MSFYCHWWKWAKQFIQIDLEDKYYYPSEKDFAYPTVFVMQAAIENYCIKNNFNALLYSWEIRLRSNSHRYSKL